MKEIYIKKLRLWMKNKSFPSSILEHKNQMKQNHINILFDNIFCLENKYV